MSTDYDSIRKRAEKRVNRRFEFYRKLGGYLVVNLIVWGIYFVTSGFRIDGTPWPLFVTFFAGIGIVKEGIEVFGESGFMNEMRERDFQRELEREKDRVYGAGYEKPKNDVVGIGDDGELVYSDEVEPTTEKHKLGRADE